MKRLSAALAAFALAVSAHAADLRIGLAADVTSMDPHFHNIGPNNLVAWHVFDALTRVDENARLVPGLAESWRAIDPTTWEFKLRKGVKFHDGSELTAEDVLFSIDRPATLDRSPGPFTTFTRPIVAKEAPDRYTVRLRTASPYAMVPYDMNSIFIVSKKAAAGATQADFDSGKAMIGTGPYRFVAFRRGDRVELARHEGHWDARPAWERVTLRILPNDPARTAALLAGDVDAIESVPTADATRLAANPSFRTESKVSWRTLFLTLDQARDSPPGVTDRSGRPLARNPFKDPRVRLAFSKAINRQAIVERMMEGYALPASNLVAPPIFGYAQALQPEPHDPEGARRLLAGAGYPDGFAIVLAAPNNRYVNDEQVAQAVAQMLARVGVAARVEALPAAAYFPKARAGEFAVAMLGWGSFSADLALRSLALTPDPDKGFGTWNWGRYSNPKVDQLVVQALATVDEGKREALAREAMTVAMREHAVIPLHHQMATWAMRKELAYRPRTDEYTFAFAFRPR
ncbi:MAG: ABC transporter substrate-binding protein [Burkholderiales bacterium]|nr:ABC transporter substrate-binding protein [Burkholderiales bacterium]